MMPDPERRLSPRGERTRSQLIAGARKVFQSTGFSAARVTDIADAAGVAHGSFYTYFDSKEDVCTAVVDEVLADMYESTQGTHTAADPFEALADSNRRFFEAYLRNRKLLVMIDEITGINPDFFVRHQELRDEFVRRYAAVLRHLQHQGRVRKDIDPHHAAGALGAMAEDSMRWWLGRGERHDPAVAIDTLNKLWAGAIGLMPA